MAKFRFYVQVYENGQHAIGCFCRGKQLNYINSVLHMFHNIEELKWLEGLVKKAKEKGVKENAGLNYVNVLVDNNECEIFTDFDRDNPDKISTELLFSFIREAIEFHNLYNNGKIPTLKSGKNK